MREKFVEDLRSMTTEEPVSYTHLPVGCNRLFIYPVAPDKKVLFQDTEWR